MDDEESVRISLTKILEYSGYEVVIARDGMEALAELERETFDLVLTDHCMPQISGLQLMRMIKLRHPSLPIVVITGERLVDDFLESGAFAVLQKPFDVDDVLSVIQAVLEGSPAAEKRPISR